MSVKGYYRFPTIYADNIVFTCEDDLWSVPSEGGIARRLTAGKGVSSMPRFSPDGKRIAFICTEEGNPEIYVMPAKGGDPKRISYLGTYVHQLSGWTKDGKEILFASNYRSAFINAMQLYAIDVETGAVRPFNYGDGQTISMGDDNATVIGRNNSDPARWKRYRGGLAGDLWVDAKGKGEFERLIELKGNLVCPMWIGQRVYFLSDHEGVGNIYSCESNGSDLKHHSDHDEYYVRYPSTDGKRIVYTAGGDIYVLDTFDNSVHRLDVLIPSAPTQSTRKFVPVADRLEHVSPHPKGHSVALISRGQPFTMPLWEEAPIQHGVGSRVRYRLSEWLSDGKRFAVVNDQPGHDQVEIHYADQSEEPVVVTADQIGRITELVPSPKEDTIAIANHRQELFILDVKAKIMRKVDESASARICDLAWSPDGKWLAYSWSPDLYFEDWERMKFSIIRILDVANGKKHDVTDALRTDYCPSFDPEGKYLYFIGVRDFNPVYDEHQFELSFPQAARPFVVPLKKDTPSPFIKKPMPIAGELPVEAKKDDKKAEKENGKDDVPPVEIDFDGISSRILAFPVEEGRYPKLVAVKDRVIFTKLAVKGIRRDFDWLGEGANLGTLMAYDLKDQKLVTIASDAEKIRLANDHRSLFYRSRNKIRVVDALAPLSSDAPAAVSDEVGRKSGWVDLGRAHVLVEPKQEWQQMYDEAWRMQIDQFWDEKMSDIDWPFVHKRYAKLLPLVRTRSELSDLIWEMHGELGTSHVYEFLGDHRHPPYYQQGFLGADISFDEKKTAYRIDRIIRGDSWDRGCDSPLAEPGVNVNEGEFIVAVGGRAIRKDCSLQELLVNTGDKNVALTIMSSSGAKRQVVVKTLREEHTLRYRNWVETNRRIVHEKSKGKLGYLHIPDMGPPGFAEFHRGYLLEMHRMGLVIDVRYNRGGHVSGLLLEKLARKRVGYSVPRWGRPVSYPYEAPFGPMVCLTNEKAGSDGDIFSHGFKLYKLGPLVGKRTWGGVIGISPNHRLVDGTITTQPEFSFWFKDVGWAVENYGTDPDHDIDISPQDHVAERDPQLEKGIELLTESLEKNPVKLPDFSKKPSLPIPQLVAGGKK
ncbi:MAG: PDZ domain-containing protein [Candidatus Obscuribacterales bacterium]|nr:PDZ domain-containing protein [Candidatus Obscuribacterales bacterium]